MTHARLRMTTRRGRRRGALAVEAAVLLSALCVPCLMAVNLALNFHAAALIDNCARNGALCWSDRRIAKKLGCLNPETGAVDVQKAALIGAESLSPPPKVTWVEKTDSAGNSYVEVTVDYNFEPATEFPGALKRITRRAWMRKLPLPAGSPAP